MRDRILALRRVKASELVADPRNWRTHPKEQRSALLAAINELGYAVPILAREHEGKLHVIDGHLRSDALKDEEVPVVVLDVSEDEAAKLIATVDPLSAMARMDRAKLDALMQQLQLRSPDLRKMLENIKPYRWWNGKTDPDEIPEVDKNSVGIMPGDLFELGHHRLLCGDSTKAEDVHRACNRSRAVASITDPPYAVGYDFGFIGSNVRRANAKTVHSEGDQASHYLGFIDLLPTDVLIMSYGDRHVVAMCEATKRNHFTIRKMLIWVKANFSFQPGACYQQKHEAIWIWVKDGKPLNADVPDNQSTVLEVSTPPRHEKHSTQKPIALWELLVRYHSKPGDMIYEPFSGSGTTIMACETLGRRCFAIEIVPQYVQVAIDRWEAFTGRKAEKIA